MTTYIYHKPISCCFSPKHSIPWIFIIFQLTYWKNIFLCYYLFFCCCPNCDILQYLTSWPAPITILCGRTKITRVNVHFLYFPPTEEEVFHFFAFAPSKTKALLQQSTALQFHRTMARAVKCQADHLHPAFTCSRASLISTSCQVVIITLEREH